MRIFIGSGHAGFELKQELSAMLERDGYEIIDKGAFARNPEDDYPDFVKPVAEEITADPEARGIILGGSGQGEAMAANRYKGVRAGVYYGETLPSPEASEGKRREQTDADGNTLDMITSMREHNDANVLSIAARFVDEREAKEATRQFLDTPFSGVERHVRRINKLDA